MKIEELLEKNYVEAFEAEEAEVDKKIRLAERDLKKSKKDLEGGDFDWALAIAYNSMLQAGTALLFREGYRPKGERKHIAVLEFLHMRFGKELTDKLITIFDKIRKKRHITVYETPEIISVEEAEFAVNTAEKFLSEVKKILGKTG